MTSVAPRDGRVRDQAAASDHDQVLGSDLAVTVHGSLEPGSGFVALGTGVGIVGRIIREHVGARD